MARSPDSANSSEFGKMRQSCEKIFIVKSGIYDAIDAR